MNFILKLLLLSKIAQAKRDLNNAKSNVVKEAYQSKIKALNDAYIFIKCER